MHVGPAGVLALSQHVDSNLLESMLADAREFAAEWLEMRPVFQNRLFGQCLRAPLQACCAAPPPALLTVFFL